LGAEVSGGCRATPEPRVQCRRNYPRCSPDPTR
jgi:hypothetical protein